MPKNINDLARIGLCGAVLLGLSVSSILLPDQDTSQSERRRLAQLPECSLKTIMDGSFMSKFESYALDQFPLRDEFRTLKARVSLNVMQKKDNNDIYLAEDYVSKIDYPLSDASIHYAADVFQLVYDRYLADASCETYLAVIPDKNYFLAEQHGYPALDYTQLVTRLTERMSYAQYIDIFPCLTLQDYYRTDTHWMQENIEPVAALLLEQMQAPYAADHSTLPIDAPFYGVYYGQSALSLEPDRMCRIVKPSHEQCVVTDLETNSRMDIYNMEMLKEADPYEMYLSGSKSLIHIENPSAKSDKQLILFRDSFGSSIVPYFTDSYQSIYLVDIRYIHPNVLGNLIDFSDSDVLFLYSTLILNHSNTLKK